MIRKNKTDPPTGTVRRFVYVAWMLLLLLGSSNDAAAQTAAKTTPNRLIHESSPYLLQHATNPVDWYPWGEEAFQKARKEDKPIFLSIGYSTCHWCHVMAHESFADEDVATLLNQYFVSVKVDREERPDIDQVYMAVTQTMTGRGGWPNSVFLTLDKKPFFAGTYFPKQTRWGLPAAKDTRAMLTALRTPFLPSKVVLLRPADKKTAAEIIRMAPYTEFMVPKDGRATAYVCTNFVCKLPTTDISQMLANLRVK